MDIIFNKKEKSIISTLYKSGASSVSDISKETLINRTTLYPILNRLQNKGVLYTAKVGEKSFFHVISKVELKSLIQRQRKKIIFESEKIDSWINQIDQDGTSLVLDVKHYEGFDGVKTLYSDSWRNNKEGVIHSLTDYQKTYDVLGKFMREDYFKMRISHGVKVRSLLPDSKVGREDLKKAKDLLREMRFIDLFENLNIELNIYDDKISLIALDKKNPKGVLIKNEVMANAFLLIFDFLWKNSEKNRHLSKM